MSTSIEARHMQYRQQLYEVDSAELQLQRLPPHLRQNAMQTLDNLQHGRNAYGQNLARLNEVGNANLMGQQQQYGQQQPQQQVQSCRLVEGFPCFRAIDTQGWGGTANIVLARAVGQVVPQVSMHEFVVRRVVNVFIVPPQTTTVDMNMIQNNQQLQAQLVEVQAPPMSGLGVLLVPKEALGLRGGMGDQRGILTDARMRQPTGQQQLLTNSRQPQQPVRPGFLPPTFQQNGSGKGLLKG